MHLATCNTIIFKVSQNAIRNGLFETNNKAHFQTNRNKSSKKAMIISDYQRFSLNGQLWSLIPTAFGGGCLFK